MKRGLKTAALVVAGLLLLTVGYGTLIEPRLILDVERERMRLPYLSEAWDGTRIALVADLQIGMWFANEGMMDRAIERIVEEAPDVALLGGDLIYGGGPPAPKVETLLDVLAPLIDSDIPTYAVLGNHDYAAGGAEEVINALEGAGIPVLRNQAVALPAPQGAAEPLYLVGIGPLRPGLDDVDAALAGLPETAPRVVLMHNPLTFPKLPAGAAPLALAGHTHCGQIALPFTEHWSWLDVTAQEKIVADAWNEEGYGAPGNEMFVTCGIGFSVVPVRVDAPPQVAMFDLVSSAG